MNAGKSLKEKAAVGVGGPSPIPTATAFGRRLDGKVLDFVFTDGKYLDSATGSEWNILGEAVAGPLKGKRLPSVDSGVHFAFAWLAFNPASEIVRSIR